jgi:hypothetical protein
LKNGYKNVEVINCSIGGTNKCYRNYNLIKYHVANYDPDYVIFSIYIPFKNDNEARDVYKNYVIRYAVNNQLSRLKAMKEIDRIENKKYFIFFYNKSFIFRAICKKYYEKMKNKNLIAKDMCVYIEKRYDAPEALEYQFSINTSVMLLKQLRDILNAQNCKLILLKYADLYYEKYDKICKDNNFEYIYINIKENKEVMHKYDGHYNEVGHEFIANELYKQFVSNYLKNEK